MSAAAPSKSPQTSSVHPPVILILSGALNPTHCMHLQCLFEVKTFLERVHGFNVIAGYLSPSSDEYLLKKLGEWAMSFEHRAALAATMIGRDGTVTAAATASSSAAPAAAAGAGMTAKAMTPLQAALAKKAGHSAAAAVAPAPTAASSSAASSSFASALSLPVSSPAVDYSWLHVYPRGEFDSHKVAKCLLSMPEYSAKRHPGLRVYEVFGADFVVKTKIYLREKRFFVCVPREGSSAQLTSQLAALDPKKRAAIEQSKSFLHLPAVGHASADLSSTKIRAALNSSDQSAWQQLVSSGWITQASLDYMIAHWTNLWIVPRNK